MVDGGALSALVVGGGRVATRKVIALLEAGAHVRVVAPEVAAELDLAATGYSTLEVLRTTYAAAHMDNAMLVIAATDDAVLNAQIARDAQATGRLVNVVTAPELGNCVTPAVHRAGDVVIAVTAGGVPAAAKRIRDFIAGSVDSRHGTAIRHLAELRRSLLDSGRRERWSEAALALVGDDFMPQIESGDFVARVAEWR
jgi:precorrin-2 dehydrogenase/sirohydrochlorin ferrochelatase